MIDICLLLEGTYPYVAGGVSTWVYNLIKAMPTRTFSVVYIGGHASAYRKMHYPLCPNIVDFREHYIFDYQVTPLKKRAAKGAYNILFQFLKNFRKGNFSLLLEVAKLFREQSLSLYDFAYGKYGWEIIRKLYSQEEEEVSFLDYFWSCRFIYLPLFSLLKIKLPSARIYHSVSTGYAGLLGGIAKTQSRGYFILTEHGIYTRERRIDIASADWIYSADKDEVKVKPKGDFFKNWWMNFFFTLSHFAYYYADEIISLYKGAQEVQNKEGAKKEKLRIIANGVDVESFISLGKVEKKMPLVGFVGRVVPIKDVKTFIKAAKVVKNILGKVKFLILGPVDEDELYYEDCRLLVSRLGLEKDIRFMGKVDLKKYYPLLDLVVLTSISEGQPIVILESFACGIPVVATDVGACRELLEGSCEEDKKIGKAGIITPVSDAKTTAEAIISLLQNKDIYNKMSSAAKKRVSTYYDINYLMANYELLYTKYGEMI